MRIDIQYLNTAPDWAAKKYITERLFKLQSHYNWIINMNVHMKNENDEYNKNKVVELKLAVPDATLFAEAREESFCLAAREAMDEMEKQLNKYKTRRTSPHMERKLFHKMVPALY